MHTQIAFTIYRTCNEKLGGRRPLSPSIFAGWTQKNCKMYLRNFLFVYFSPSFFSQTSFMYTLPILQAILITMCTFFPFWRKERKKNNGSDFAQLPPPRQSMEIVYIYSTRGRKRQCKGKNSFMKYFWINCLVLLFAKYNNKWLIMAGIFLFDWYKERQNAKKKRQEEKNVAGIG